MEKWSIGVLERWKAKARNWRFVFRLKDYHGNTQNLREVTIRDQREPKTLRSYLEEPPAG